MGNQQQSLSGNTVKNGNADATEVANFRLNVDNTTPPSHAIQVDTNGLLLVPNIIITNVLAGSSLASSIVVMDPCNFYALFKTVITQFAVVATLTESEINKEYILTLSFTSTYLSGDPIEYKDNLLVQNVTWTGSQTNVVTPFVFATCDEKTNCLSYTSANILMTTTIAPNLLASLLTGGISRGTRTLTINASVTLPFGTYPVFNNMVNASSFGLGQFTVTFGNTNVILFSTSSETEIINVKSTQRS